jgi:hypothetical protein
VVIVPMLRPKAYPDLPASRRRSTSRSSSHPAAGGLDVAPLGTGGVDRPPTRDKGCGHQTAILIAGRDTHRHATRIASLVLAQHRTLPPRLGHDAGTRPAILFPSAYQRCSGHFRHRESRALAQECERSLLLLPRWEVGMTTQIFEQQTERE